MKLKKHFKGHYNFIVLDNDGETFDRYTIILSNGDIFGSSFDPFHTQGFGQWCGNIADNYMTVSYGSQWRKNCRVKVCTNEAIKNYLSDCSNVGYPVNFETLPDKVKQYVKQISKY